MGYVTSCMQGNKVSLFQGKTDKVLFYTMETVGYFKYKSVVCSRLDRQFAHLTVFPPAGNHGTAFGTKTGE